MADFKNQYKFLFINPINERLLKKNKLIIVSFAIQGSPRSAGAVTLK